MKNKEKFKDEILEIACSGHSFAINKKSMKFEECHNLSCSDCLFSNSKDCNNNIREWSEEEYKEPLSAETAYDAFSVFCDHTRICKNCKYSGANLSSKCAVKFIFDNYKVVEKEANEK